MDYRIDLDPTHRVIRLTVTAVVTEELAEACYQSLWFIASRGGPYAAIFDLSGVTGTTLSPMRSEVWRDALLRSQREDPA